MKQKMETILQEVQNGSTVDEAIYKVLNIDATPIREKVHAYFEENRILQAKYEGWDTAEAICHEVAERTENDCAKQFSWLSGIKRQCNLYNLKYSESVLREQGTDIELMRSSIEEAYQAEQKMSADATEEELEVLKQELAEALPDEQLSIRQAVLQELDAEEADPLKEALDAAKDMTEEQEDYTVMSAAILISDDDNTSQEDAVAAACWHTAEVFDFSMKLLFGVVPELLGEAVASLAISLVAGLLGVSVLSEIFTMVGMAAIFAGGVTAAVAGVGLAYVGFVKCLPYIKKACQKAWQKVKPHVEKLAAKVKKAVLQLAGVVVDKVFRPAIYWVHNTAIPAIKENVIYPLKRRLQAMLEWFRDKKERFMQFVEDAKLHKEPGESNNSHEERHEKPATYGKREQSAKNPAFAK